MAKLECIHGKDLTEGLALIFVHGLGGDSNETWTHNPKDPAAFWPRWVAEDCGCQTWTLSYDASLSAWKDNAMPLPDQGDAVLDCLASNTEINHRPLLLIGHSLGGLLIKTLIVSGHSKGVARYQALIELVCGVVFIATPHNGSQLANLAQAIKLFLLTNEQVGNLIRGNTHLRNLHQQFLAQQKKQEFRVRTFAEGKPMLLGRKVRGFRLGIDIMVVDPNSAEPHIPGDIAIPLPEDHLSICKPKDRNEQIHQSLVSFIREIAGSATILPASPDQAPGNIPSLHSNRLPSTTGQFFGRAAELTLLTDSLNDSQTAIVQFIAAGGTGKTKLLQYWLDGQARLPALIAWSFYSQGSDEDKQVSATPFFEHLFDLFNTEQRQFRSEDEKGEYVAGLLLRQPVVLVLDGLEPLQHGGFGMKGELKDRALRVLLRKLAGKPQPASLCVITSRLTVADLEGRTTVKAHDLHNLELADGVALLQSLHVLGSQAELEQAVCDYGHHALALSLLGHAVNYWLEGDVRRRDTITELLDGDDSQSRHAFKVMQAYAAWLGHPELTVLHMLGLFDHPVENAVLRLLREQQIPGLTAGMAERDFNQALQSLKQDHHLLTGQPDTVDCHPLLREYFGKRLRQNPTVWQAAQQRLYEYYKTLPQKYQPDTLAEMQPLFAAISHGCAAGLHQQALDEVYWPRVLREDQYYLTKKLGAFSDDLAVLAHFFIQPWQEPAADLIEDDKAVVLNRVGFDLRALGRLVDASQPMQASLAMRVQQKDWKQAAIEISNLGMVSVGLGDLTDACEYGRQAMNYADQSGDWVWRMGSRCALADALLHSGSLPEAVELFRAAEQIQQEFQPEYPYLYSVRGFCYCDYLLKQGAVKMALEQAQQTLLLTKIFLDPLDTALNQLTLALAHSQLALQTPAEDPSPAFDAESSHARQAREFFDLAVVGLQAAGQQDYLARGLLARAAWFLATQDYERAHKDLDEAKELAESGPMRLHLCDYHLESARLALAENRPDDARAHRREAAQLIEATGYKRRLPELQALPK